MLNLEVKMHDAVAVDKGSGLADLSQDHPCRRLRQHKLLPHHAFKELTAGDSSINRSSRLYTAHYARERKKPLHDEDDVAGIGREDLVEVDESWVVELLHDLDLSLHLFPSSRAPALHPLTRPLTPTPLLHHPVHAPELPSASITQKWGEGQGIRY